MDSGPSYVYPDKLGNGMLEDQNLVTLKFDEIVAPQDTPPVETGFKNENTYIESHHEASSSVEPFHCVTTLIISREGRRNMTRNNESTYMNRVRKSAEQTRFLIGLFDKTNGRVPKEIRRKAELATGLTWIQIYKWIFDRKSRQKEFDVYRLLDYPVPIFRVTNKYGKDITGKRPIFKVERVATAARRVSGKPGTH
jgi:hypothetical protein